MIRILLTGMSGTGKSTIIRALAGLGYKAVDADTDEWSEWVSITSEDDPFDPPIDEDTAWRDRDWVWRKDRIQRLLSTEEVDVLFVSGTASNQGKFHPQFDHIILLSAPTDILMERLTARSDNLYGKDPAERARVLQHIQTVEPLLRRAASAEVDTSAPVGEVLASILEIVQPHPPRGNS